MPVIWPQGGLWYTSDIMRTLLLGLLCLLAGLAWAAMPTQPGSYYLTYRSAIDDSDQPFGLYVPQGFNPAAAHPVVLIGHGFGSRAAASFSSYQRSFADANGWLLVQADGRGNTFYDGVGEVDVFDLLATLRGSYQLDEDRLYFEGPSMGATGAYRLGVRHPDLFAAVGGADGWTDYHEWYTHWYGPTRNVNEIAPCRLPLMEMTSALSIAEQARWLHLYMIVDEFDSTVPRINSERLRDAFLALGGATPEDDYRHVYHLIPGGSHTAGYSQATLYPYFKEHTRRTTPPAVLCKTRQLKYGAQYWTRIDRLQGREEFATLSTEKNGDSIAVTANGVLQFTLQLDSRVVAGPTVMITINGVPAYSGPVEPVTFAARPGRLGMLTWSTSPGESLGVRKVAGLEGPIGDAYTAPFLVAYGTAGTAMETAANKAEADAFCANWNSWMHAAIVAKAESVVTPAELQAKNLVLYGTIESSALLAQMGTSLPLQVHAGEIRLGATRYQGVQYGAYFIYPNPLAPARYVVVSHLTVPGTRIKDLEALPWYWPDFVIFDTTKTAGPTPQASLRYLPDTFVTAGFFDEAWRLPAHAPQPDLVGSVNGASVGDGQYLGQAQTLALTGTGTVRVENDGASAERFLLLFDTLPDGWTVTVREGATERTAALTGAGWLTPTLASGTGIDLQVTAVPSATTTGTTTCGLRVSTLDGRQSDLLTLSLTNTPLTGVRVVPSPGASQFSGQPVDLRAIPTGGRAVEYLFRIGQRSGTQWLWTTIRPYSAEPIGRWTPTTPGQYALVVWAREGGSPVNYTCYQSIAYTLYAPLTGVALAAAPASPPRGTPVTLTATPTGGKTVQYQFRQRYRAPGSTVWSGWTTVRNYSATPVHLWQPAAAGTYTLAVYGRELGSMAYAAYQAVQVTVR
jgi:pimeloyl-ACP methyl ester carboxylesterase